MKEVQLGRIYKRKDELRDTIDGAYPDYIINVKIHDKLLDQNRYKMYDLKRAKESVFIIRQRIVEKYYDLVENE